MSASIILHHLNVSRSNRIFWALEELELPYNVQVHYRLPTRSAPPSLKEVSPLGRAPALTIDGKLYTESSFIVHSLLALPDVRARAKNGELQVQVEETEGDVFWSHFAEGSQMNLFQASATVGATSAGWLKGAPGVPELSEEAKKGIQQYTGWLQEAYLKPNIQSTIDFAENALAKQDAPFFSGTDKPGEGDFLMFFAIDSLLQGTRKDAGFTVGPNLKKWHETVLARPAAQRALKRQAEEEEKQRGKAKI
ncbi:hypothetical protein L202_02662 [Cryptococcus amylolentus CBS 6039]|uniref:GST C-terminal domain-containing protein n=2 Tax=Cryptococcus amylolentus TaxID=104669 RepID=A0A1E3HVR3_9TREE|nr:hypothetical protein L202_02662 [Cryptococcus amylolentus CBS 6039]ODN80413.1 hypothetical protein L202_02662 [Cryptococcus amylolentus CBS 6039]ODO09042.1 hypothetical protein I350_02640 [Cryptococcus amylolentus CBS 6273]